MSELRASASAVSRPPYDSPQMPTRAGSTSARRLQILRAGDDVLVLGVAAAFGVRRAAERVAVADAAAIVDRHHDVALRLQPLVVRVRPVIELHVVIRRAASGAAGPPCTKTIAGPLLAGLQVLRQEELIVNLHSVGRVRDHDLRRHVRVGREILEHGRRREDDLRVAAGHRHDADRRRLRGVEVEHRDALAGRERRRRHFDAVVRRDLHSACRRRPARPRCAASRCPSRSCSRRASCRRATRRRHERAVGDAVVDQAVGRREQHRLAAADSLMLTE